MTSIMQSISNAAQAMAPSMFAQQKMEPAQSPSMRGKMIPTAPPMPTEEDLNKHYLVPLAPPMPTDEDLNKHYLSRDKTFENVAGAVQSSLNFVSEVAADVAQSMPSAEELKTKIPAAIGLGPKLDDNGIPIPPALPSREAMHKHYLIPLAPAMPTKQMLHKHYLIPMAPPMPTKEDLNMHYMSRDKTLENASNILRSAANVMSNFAQDIKAKLPSTADLGLTKPLDANGIPIPPALPTQEMLHKHYLVPLAPPMPTKEAMNKHYMSRDKTLENAGNSILSAVHLAEEIAVDAKDAVVDGAFAAKDAVLENALGARDIVVDGAESATQGLSNAMSAAANSASATKDAVVDTAVAAKDAVVDGAVQLKEKVLAAPQKQPVGLKYPRSEVISESPILKKKSAGSRRIVARNDYNGFKPLLASAQRI